MRCALLATLLVALAACARTQLPAVTSVAVARAESKWPGTTEGELVRGRQIYAASCSSCHQPVQPNDLRPEEWPGHVAEMQVRAGLNEEEAELVRRYLVTMAEDAR